VQLLGAYARPGRTVKSALWREGRGSEVGPSPCREDSRGCEAGQSAFESRLRPRAGLELAAPSPTFLTGTGPVEGDHKRLMWFVQLCVRGAEPIIGATGIPSASVSGSSSFDDRPMPGDLRGHPIGGVFAAGAPGGVNRNAQKSCPPRRGCSAAAASASGPALSAAAAIPGTSSPGRSRP
jgi:hypothetical protein